MKVPTRAEALELLHAHTEGENLRKHAYAVEAAMRTYARHLGEDEELWGVVGLLHDFDYERFPSLEDHPFKGAEILRSKGYAEEIIRAILSHADHTGIARETPLQRALFGVDELCGFVTAVALVRPSRSLADVTVKSVKKKMKDKAFARAVKREDIHRGAEEVGVDLDTHIGNVIDAMRTVADDLGL